MENMTVDTGNDRAPFGDLLRRYRTLAGMSQELLAERAGLTPNGIGSLERGARKRPHPHTIHAIAEALNLGNAEHNALIEAASGARARPERPKPERVETPAELPISPSPLIGRDQAVREVSELLLRDDVRLVTLTGIGGVGKTRLALEIARTTGGAWPDGVVFVSLAALNDPALLISTLARAIGLQDMAGDQVRQQLHARLKSRRMLLVLDNLEHLLPVAAAEVAELLAATDALTVLATSRAPLQIRAELEMPVGPLSLGQPAESGDDGAGTAVELFVLRARDVRPSFELTDANAATIAAICRQLGGLPLAIELAAAWTRVLTPDDLLARLDHVLSVEGARDLPTRQRTMRATLDWSHSLLSPAEQVLFRRLAVFSGGFTLEAAEAVCPDGPEGAGDVLEGVGRLVEHSLVTSNTATEPVRVRDAGAGAAVRGRAPRHQWRRRLAARPACAVLPGAGGAGRDGSRRPGPGALASALRCRASQSPLHPPLVDGCRAIWSGWRGWAGAFINSGSPAATSTRARAGSSRSWSRTTNSACLAGSTLATSLPISGPGRAGWRNRFSSCLSSARSCRRPAIAIWTRLSTGSRPDSRSTPGISRRRGCMPIALATGMTTIPGSGLPSASACPMRFSRSSAANRRLRC